MHRLLLGANLTGTQNIPPRPAGAGCSSSIRGGCAPIRGWTCCATPGGCSSRAFPTARLLVAGEGDAEDCASAFLALPGVEVRPAWLAEDEMARLIAGADGVVLPYREASQSGVTPIAHGFGVPVVATPVGGRAEQLRDGVDGVVARGVTAEAFAEAMAVLCDPARRAALAAGALETGRRLNDRDAMAGELIAALGGPSP